MVDLGEQLSAIAKKMNAHFIFNGQPMSYNQVFSERGVLPAMAKRADQLCSLCMGYGIGASFSDDEEATLGYRVTFDDETPHLLRLMCLTDVVVELVQSSYSGATTLDELMYE